MKLGIVDSGYGNIGSITFAFERLGVEAVASADPAVLVGADRILLPGVGHAGHAMRRIEALGLAEFLRAVKQPALGICLGMQLLFEHSAEDAVDCLGIIPGAVRAIEPAPGRPVPHMGWTRIETDDDAVGLASGDYCYFAHGFACADGPATVARVDYGGPIPVVVRHGNWLGAQFHPERSAAPGARFLEAFLG